MSQFAPEDRQGAIDLVSDGDITFESDRNQDGAGDLVFRTGGVERSRIKANGSGTGWANVLGGSQPATNGMQSVDTTGATDVGALLQATYDAGNRTIYFPFAAGANYLLDSPVFFDSGALNEIVTLDLNGGTLTLGTHLPTVSAFKPDFAATWGLFPNALRASKVTAATASAWAASTRYSTGQIVTDGAGNLFSCSASGGSGGSAPTWNTTPATTTTDSGVTWTCMGTGPAVDCGFGSSMRNNAHGNLVTKPHLIVRNGILDGGNAVTGFSYGCGAATRFEDVIFNHYKYGTCWTGYVDGGGGLAGDWYAANPVSAGNEAGAWLIRQLTNGDGIEISSGKAENAAGVYKGTLCHGMRVGAVVGGSFDFTECQGIEFAGWHREMLSASGFFPALALNRTKVTLKQCRWVPGYAASSYFCTINDDTTDVAQATQLVLDDCCPAVEFSSSFVDTARVADIHVAAANDGMTITATGLRAGISSPSHTSYDPDAIIIDSEVAAITTALTSGTYGQLPAAVARDFILRKSNAAWGFDSYAALPGVRSYPAQAAPTLAISNTPFGLLPTISSIVTNGATWTLTFASNHSLSAGSSIVLAGFTPSGYNGTFTVASVPSLTTVTITNATSPGAVTVTGTSCTSGNVVGTLVPGTSYDYLVAMLADDGSVTTYPTDVTAAATATGTMQLTGSVSAPGDAVVVWRKAAGSGVASGPDFFCVIPLGSTRFKFIDTGVNIQGRPWTTTNMPTPNVAFAATNALAARQPIAISGFTAWGTGGVANLINSSSGTSNTMVAGDWYWVALPVYFTSLITGVVIPAGSVGGTDKWLLVLYNAAGQPIANTALAGTTAPTANTKTRIAFTAQITLAGPACYFLALQSNGTTAKYLGFPNATEGFITGHQGSGSFGTIPHPLTLGSSYVQNQGPMASLY